MPQINEVFIRSDNAGCNHCAPLWLSLYGISSRTGITIKRYDYSEAQAGKSYCDLKIAHMRGKMRVYAASGYNITTTADMKKALDSGTGVVVMLTDRVLNKLANELGADWKNLLIHLDMKPNQMQLIEGNYQKDIHREAFEALISWRDSQKSTEPTIRRVDRLKKASSTIERQDIVGVIESVLKELLTDKTLKEMAYRLSKVWRTAFLDLGMKYTDVVMIERDYCSDLLKQAFEALILWRNVHSKKLLHHEMLIQLKNVAQTIQTRAVIDLIDKIEIVFVNVVLSDVLNIDVGVGCLVSQDKQTGQSTPYSCPSSLTCGAGAGVDGIKSPTNMFHTNDELEPFWWVNLGEVYEVQKVVSTYRIDCCVAKGSSTMKDSLVYQNNKKTLARKDLRVQQKDTKTARKFTESTSYFTSLLITDS
ncbi:Hypothetical predicted protein [Mytilus galloprovincialis]|uniref:Death domain-containing protein n=1 Tax=Mytilus galloprovincialis TaxID=29158 RepID=A0A8B6DSW1_MYTGA|nr:Hypothetical predicted protein [Mytilus galloprovincialis]